jgi:hypothetical protein
MWSTFAHDRCTENLPTRVKLSLVSISVGALELALGLTK